MVKARIAILLLVAMLMFMAYANDRQARVIEQQKQQIRIMMNQSTRG